MNCYNCGKPLTSGARTCASCGQAVYVENGADNAPALGRRLDGCRFGAPSPKDYIATPRAGAIARKVDLRADQSPVEDQGQLRSCTANATCAALEYYRKKHGQPATHVSRLFAYFNARRMIGAVAQDSGAYVSEALASLLAFGTPDAALWADDPASFAREAPTHVYQAALANQPPEYARVEAGDGVRGALAQAIPVIFGMALPMRCFEEAGAKGRFPAPTDAERAQPAANAGHAMLAVGYDLDEDTFLIRNSWGATWGEKGYARMPAKVLAEFAHPTSYWILGKLSDRPGLDVVRPAKVVVANQFEGQASKHRDALRPGLEADMAKAAQAIRDRLRKPPK